MKSLLKEIEEQIRSIEYNESQYQSFGLLVGSILAGIALFFVFRFSGATTLIYVLTGISIALVVPAILFPALLKIPYKIWMSFAMVLGGIVSTLLLILLFYFLLTPIALLAKLFGKQSIDTTFKDDKMSYWKKYNTESDMTKPF